MACEKPFKVMIGRLGQAQIEKGLCLYTGSALGRGGSSIEKRVSRHYRKNKRIKWHVDFLTVRPEIVVKMAVCLESSERFECRISQLIISKLHAKPLVLRAGATDCSCDGHLLFLRFTDDINKILSILEQIYSRFGRSFRL
jgi:sugar fermentation stimulation protein A